MSSQRQHLDPLVCLSWVAPPIFFNIFCPGEWLLMEDLIKDIVERFIQQ